MQNEFLFPNQSRWLVHVLKRFTLGFYVFKIMIKSLHVCLFNYMKGYFGLQEFVEQLKGFYW